MKNYISFLDNGEIIKTGSCSDDSFELQGPNVIEGVADDSTQYIENRIVVNMPQKPNGASYFDYSSKQWVLNYPFQELTIKIQRDQFLSKSDWTQIPGNPLTPEKQTEWAIYRQELRDITSQPGYPFDVVWPTQPK